MDSMGFTVATSKSVRDEMLLKLRPVIADAIREVWPAYSNRSVILARMDDGKIHFNLGCAFQCATETEEDEHWHKIISAVNRVLENHDIKDRL